MKHDEQVSLSLRRAWIEMAISLLNPYQSASLSLRRAWIEIQSPINPITQTHVALLTESVD